MRSHFRSIRCQGIAAICLLAIMTASQANGEVIGYWPLDGNGTASVGEDGIFVNDPSAAPDRNGTAGGALLFEGFDQYVEVPEGGGLDGILGGTISMWVNWSGPQNGDCCGTFGAVLSRQGNGLFSDNILALNDPDPGFANLVWRQHGGPAAPLITSTDIVGDEQWRHLAVTFSPDESELFLDGVSQGTAVGVTPLHSNTAVPLSIGAWSGDGNGYSFATIDDVAIFDDLLSATQIASLAAGTATPLNVGPGTPITGPEPPVLPADLIPVTIFSVSSNLKDNSGFDRTAEYAVNGAGLTAEDGHSIAPEGTMWLNNGSFVEPNDFDPEITFDLGSVRSIDRMKIWNYNETLEGRPELLGRGVSSANILVAGEDQVFTTLISEQDFDVAPGDATIDFGQIVDLMDVQARYVRFEILGNHDGDNDFVGLSEVRFFGPTTPNGDFNGDGVLDAADIDALTAEVLANGTNLAFDLNADELINDADRQVWIKDLRKTWIGDADLNDEFNSGDLVQVFQRGEFEDGIALNSGWGDGDWDGDGDFTTSDFVLAFQEGGYEVGPLPSEAVSAVPEPASVWLVVAGSLGLLALARGKR